MRNRLGILLAGAFMAAASTPADAELSLTVVGGSVEASGVTPGASVAWLGLSRPDLEFETVFVPHRTLLTDSDNDGLVVLTPEAGIPWKSVFVAIDLSNLDYAVAAPEGFEFPLAFQPPGLLGSDLPGELDEIQLSRHQAEVLVARMGEGAFGLGGWDGGDADGDGLANDTLVFPASALANLAGTSASPTALTTFEAGDLFVVIDPTWMEVSLYLLPEVAP